MIKKNDLADFHITRLLQHTFLIRNINLPYLAFFSKTQNPHSSLVFVLFVCTNN